MNLYLDLLFILNFLFDFILLGSVALLLRRNTSAKRIIIASLIGASSIYLLFFNIAPFILFIYKVVISCIMILITFGYKDLRYTLKNITFLYIVSFFLGGALFALNLHFSYQQSGTIFFFQGISINWWIALILAPLFVYMFVKQGLLLKNEYSNYYMVDIYLKDGRILKCNGFVDTGNKLYDPYLKRPIILVNSKELNFEYGNNNTLLVPYEALNTKGMLKCIIPEKIHILGVGIKRNVVVGISSEKIKIDGVDCILHGKLMEA